MAEATDEIGESGGRAGGRRSRRSGARRSTARRPTPAIASWLPTTPRWRPISRPRSTRRRAERSADDRPIGAVEAAPGTVVVLDFGSQFAQLIARRVRELDVYSELLPHDTPYEELERRGTRAIILSGGPMSVYDAGRPAPGPGDLDRPDPRPRHLLRRAADGPRARRRRPPDRPTRVRAGERDDHRRRRPLRRHRARAAGLDEPRRLHHPAARRVPGDGPDRLHAVRRAGGARSATCTASSSIPRSSTRRSGRDVLRNFVVEHRGRRARPGPRPTSSTRPSRASASGSTRTRPRPARTGSSSARSRAASTRRSRPRSSIAPSATG